MIEFRCPQCRELFNIPEEFLGTTGTCRKCGQPITIEVAASDHVTDGGYESFVDRPPTLAVVHIETTGSSSRKNSIIELGSIVFDLYANEVDTFWSFANPSVSIPDKIEERTGITDEMVADAPFPSEVVERWYSWLGNHAVAFCQHGHFHAKFLSAALLNHDIEPPPLRMIDVLNWSKDLAIPVDNRRLRNLLEHIGYMGEYNHRAMDVCKALVPLVVHLARKQVGVHMEAEGAGVLGMIRGRTVEAINTDAALAFFEEYAEPMDVACGPNFVPRMAYEQRKSGGNGGTAPTAAATANGDGPVGVPLHMGEWFAEMKVQIESMLNQDAPVPPQLQENGSGGGPAPWLEVVWAANEERDPAKQSQLCIEAIRLGALDPWPYEHLVDLYIHHKRYESACKVADRYFKMDAWKNPGYAETSLKLLKRLHQLEHHLAKQAAGT